MLPLDVPHLVGLALALLRAERALELGLLPALVRQVSLQGVLPYVTPFALRAGEVAPFPVGFLFGFLVTLLPDGPGL